MGDKLRTKLRALPNIYIFIIVCSVLITAAITYLAIEKNNISVLIPVILFDIIAAVVIFSVIRSLSGLRKNSRKTIKYLDENGLFEAAGKEYFGDGIFSFRLGYAEDKNVHFISRENALGENFVFAMSSNQVIRYSDISEVKFKRYFHDENSFEAVNNMAIPEILTITTNDGADISLLGVTFERSGETKKRELLDKIVFRLREKCPGIYISTARDEAPEKK